MLFQIYDSPALASWGLWYPTMSDLPLAMVNLNCQLHGIWNQHPHELMLNLSPWACLRHSNPVFPLSVVWRPRHWRHLSFRLWPQGARTHLCEMFKDILPWVALCLVPCWPVWNTTHAYKRLAALQKQKIHFWIFRKTWLMSTSFHTVVGEGICETSPRNRAFGCPALTSNPGLSRQCPPTPFPLLSAPGDLWLLSTICSQNVTRGNKRSHGPTVFPCGQTAQVWIQNSGFWVLCPVA